MFQEGMTNKTLFGNTGNKNVDIMSSHYSDPKRTHHYNLIENISKINLKGFLYSFRNSYFSSLNQFTFNLSLFSDIHDGERNMNRLTFCHPI